MFSFLLIVFIIISMKCVAVWNRYAIFKKKNSRKEYKLKEKHKTILHEINIVKYDRFLN